MFVAKLFSVFIKSNNYSIQLLSLRTSQQIQQIAEKQDSLHIALNRVLGSIKSKTYDFDFDFMFVFEFNSWYTVYISF